jgi:hypothetical protein
LDVLGPRVHFFMPEDSTPLEPLIDPR